MTKSDRLLLPFAKSILAKARALNALENDLSKSEKARMLEAISDDIKKCSNFLVPMISRAALREANRLKIDLRTKNWHDQPSFDPGRVVFHWEHVVPVSILRAECRKAKSSAEIFAILKQRARVAWILKTEDLQLTKLKFRHKRPNPDAAYRMARIRLVGRG